MTEDFRDFRLVKWQILSLKKKTIGKFCDIFIDITDWQILRKFLATDWEKKIAAFSITNLRILWLFLWRSTDEFKVFLPATNRQIYENFLPIGKICETKIERLFPWLINSSIFSNDLLTSFAFVPSNLIGVNSRF